MSLKKAILGFSIFLIYISYSYAGFGLETTRVIYNEKNNSESFVAFNSDSNTNYLLQSWVEDINGKLTQNFVITPPLIKLVAQQKNTLQVIKNTTLPDDVESMYWINVKFVAPSNEDLENVLRYSMTNRIKLIYRPRTLNENNIEKDIANLKWSVKSGNLVVNNNSPFFVNIANISINNIEMTETVSYLSPKSETIITKSTGAINKIKLTYINDFGKDISVDFLL